MHFRPFSYFDAKMEILASLHCTSALSHFVEPKNSFVRMLDSPLPDDCSLINSGSGDDYEITLRQKNNINDNNYTNQIGSGIDEEIEHNYDVVARLKCELVICICLVSIVWITGFPFLVYDKFNDNNISLYNFDDYDVSLILNVIANILDGFRYFATFVVVVLFRMHYFTFEHEFKKEILIKYDLYQFNHFKQIVDCRKLYQTLCNNHVNVSEQNKEKQKQTKVTRADRTSLGMYFASHIVQYIIVDCFNLII